MSLNAVCAGGALRRSGDYSFAGEHDFSVTLLSTPHFSLYLPNLSLWTPLAL